MFPNPWQLYGISLRLARDIYQMLDAFLTRHAPDVVFRVGGSFIFLKKELT